MEGLGNDFIVTHEVAPGDVALVAGQAVRICDRRRGVGGDGLILILPSERADFCMRIFNSDGSEAEMCGNGIRCCVRYIEESGLVAGGAERLAIETGAGIIRTEMLDGGLVRVEMGPPRLDAGEVPVALSLERVVMYPLAIGDRNFNITAISMGNPHVVIYAEDLSDELVLRFGPLIETNEIFPEKTNVEFIEVVSQNEIRMRVWERGCGETHACGTGACAAAVSGIVNCLHGNSVTVHLIGGDLLVSWSGKESDSVCMTGPARMVFAGTWLLS